MRRVRGMRMVVALVAGGLTVTMGACGTAPSPAPGGSASAAKEYQACMVTDQGGLDDKSFNASAWKGLQAGDADPSTNIKTKNVASNTEADYEPNLTAFVNQKCDFILAVGGLMGKATEKIAKANPNQQFAIVDYKAADLSNVYPMQFNTAQAAFLAGYLAAGYSKTGKVGTYGGLNIPPVTIFMDGFYEGVQHYNRQKGKTVQVLGWNPATPEAGSFTQSFISAPDGKKASDTLLAQGADVIMPVAGGTGLGTLEDAAAGKFAAIWVDVDGCDSTQYCKGILSTVVKNIPDAVRDAVIKGAKGEPLKVTEGFVGTLQNNGVSLAPYHEFDSKVDPALKAEVDKLKGEIIAGTVKVQSKAAPV